MAGRTKIPAFAGKWQEIFMLTIIILHSSKTQAEVTTVQVFVNNYGFNDIGYDLVSGGEREWAVDWKWLYGRMDTGEYRIVKDILDFRDMEEYDTYYLATEFTI